MDGYPEAESFASASPLHFLGCVLSTGRDSQAPRYLSLVEKRASVSGASLVVARPPLLSFFWVRAAPAMAAKIRHRVRALDKRPPWCIPLPESATVAELARYVLGVI